jgi:SH3-like domain-containing protein
MLRRFLLLLCLCLAAPAVASEGDTTLPVPRFVTLGTDEVNLRAGPGLRFPVTLVLKRGGLPVEIVREFDIWRQVRDMDGDEGWVHKNMLSGRRAVVIKGTLQTVLKKPKEGAKPVARLEPGVIAALKTCDPDWCRVEASGYEGWLSRAAVWGVYPGETFKE